MLAQGIPLTLLPDLAWPAELARDAELARGPAIEADVDEALESPAAPARTDFSGGPVAC